jgi:oligoribonuclease NrnB/cAMP/cGMP phosphodiesterase (DHH superfamily)
LESINGETTVVIIDFSYSVEQTREIASKAEQVIVLDHHQTALEEFHNVGILNTIILIETNKAACRVVWDFYNPDTIPPFHIDYVEDMDLWLWEQPFSDEVNAYLSSIDSTIEAWREATEEQWGDVREKGSAVVQYRNKTMDILEKQKVIMRIGSYQVPAVNCADPAMVSYLGNRLANKQPFGATFHMQANGKWKFSLRSITGEINPVGINVRKVAEQFGGGGHDNSAGFTVNKLFPFKTIGKAYR